MTNPYLSAAEEITGQDLKASISPNHIIREQVKRVYIPQLPQTKSHPAKQLPQKASFSPTSQLGNFGALSGFSKIRKMVFLAALGAGFAASKFFFNRYEVLLLAEQPEYSDLKALLPKAEKVLLPGTGLFALPVALALFSDQEWPMLSWLCWLGAVAYVLKETGPGIVRIVRDTKGAANEYKKSKLATIRKRSRKR